jgi:hypothetical protein
MEVRQEPFSRMFNHVVLPLSSHEKKKKTYVSEVIFNGVIVLEHLILYWNSWMP